MLYQPGAVAEESICALKRIPERFGSIPSTFTTILELSTKKAVFLPPVHDIVWLSTHAAFDEWSSSTWTIPGYLPAIS